MAEIGTDLRRIKGKNECRSICNDVLLHIVKFIGGASCSETGRRPTVANCVWTKTKIAAVLRQLCDLSQPGETFRTSIIVAEGCVYFILLLSIFHGLDQHATPIWGNRRETFNQYACRATFPRQLKGHRAGRQRPAWRIAGGTPRLRFGGHGRRTCHTPILTGLRPNGF